MAGITMPHTPSVRPGEDPYRPRLVRVMNVREEIAPTKSSRPVVTLELERDGIDFRPGQFFRPRRFHNWHFHRSLGLFRNLRGLPLKC